ncbi:hypothetical protein CCY99_07170 [Helicobacter sp. 16-1353]|uniref:hypothetical protein n=1 Tax=Helicobacter sp. 16-1353 TaxID=2004996 RepID=UPI000DCEC823|nr:hypothetical protein [Helicobacter sp. 16-1353]RAX52740.1 hypothetical protein CCY99_07170 [Helicobacter sp. 16-1353]
MVINIIFTVFMIILAIIDIRTTKTANHRDFKSIIMTFGVLGTFIGVFIGLLGFDINNIETSVPHLLDGLKIAFYTSIAGMSIAIIISIYQRSIGFKIDNKDNLDFITIQSKKFDKLDELSNISNINKESKNILLELKEIFNKSFDINEKIYSQMVDSNDNIKILIESNNILNNTSKDIVKQIENLNTSFTKEIQNLSNDLSNVLNNTSKDIVKQIENLNTSFTKEIEKLSNDFSADVICSINNLSTEFTNTINLHFSENFKRFNKAVDNLLEWQKEQKKNILDSNDILTQSSKSLQTIDKVIHNIMERDEKTIELYKEVTSIMKDYKTQNLILDEKLQSMRDLGNGALQSLKFMNTFFNDLNHHLKSTNETLITNTKATIDNVFIATIKDFESINKNVINNMKDRDESLLKSIESSVKIVQNLANSMIEGNKILSQNYQKLNKDLELNVKAISQNTSEMISNINKEGIKHLKNTTKLYFNDISNTQHKILNNMSNQISKNQEMLDSTLLNLINKYLESLEQITISSIKASKDINLSNIEDIKYLNNEITSYIKDNVSSLNKSNLELLNILELLNKQIEDSNNTSKIMQTRAKDSIKNIEDSLQQVSDGFKNDYEWFLRRIRDIIGQRLN